MRTCTSPAVPANDALTPFPLPQQSRGCGVVGRIDLGFPALGEAAGEPCWHIATSSWSTANSISEALGGTARPFGRLPGLEVQVVTEAASLSVLLEGPDSVSFRMARRGGRGVAHTCDGQRFLEPAGLTGTACGCPPTLTARRAAALRGLGPKPDIELVFLLHAAPELGLFRLNTSSWDFAGDSLRALEVLRQVPSPVLCRLGIEVVEFSSPDGVEVSYRRPMLVVAGSAVPPGEE
ncbi:hypothetical protein ACFVH7_38665 [Kitasatospora indigofera]|uniref:recombination directionality factor n=1 Tax=Kitasatospora indigofera TaxID=67307 RepID=UPI00364152C5